MPFPTNIPADTATASLRAIDLTSAANISRQEPPLAVIEQFNPLDPRYVERIRVTSLNKPPTHSHTLSVLVHYFNGEGLEVGEPKTFTYGVEQKQDVLGGVLFFHSADNEIRVLLCENERAPVASRQLLGQKSFADEAPVIARSVETGRIWNLPGAYLLAEKGQGSIDATMPFLCRTKLGVIPVGQSLYLGGAHLPSAGGHTEMEFLRGQEIEPPKILDGVVYYENGEFRGSRRVKAFTLQEVVDGYFAHELQDFRALEGVFRLARVLGISLQIPNYLSARLISQAEDLAAECAADTRKSRYPFISGREFEEILKTLPSDPKVAAYVNTKLLEDKSSDQFITIETVRVENLNPDGERIGEYVADVMTRRGVDSVDAGLWTIENGEPHIFVKRGIRTAITARNLEEHPIQTDPNPFSPEGVAGSVEKGRNLDLSGMKALVRQECAEEAKVRVGGDKDIQYLNSVPPSPGFNREVVHQFLTGVNSRDLADGHATIDEVSDGYWVRAYDYLDAARKGLIRDARHTLLAHTLVTALQDVYPPPAEYLAHDIHQAERDELARLMNEGSRIDAYFQMVEPELFIELMKHRILRQIRTFVEDELGVRIIEPKHEDEKRLYAAFLRDFVKQPDQSHAEVLKFFLHDSRHLSIGDLIPFEIGDDGRIKRNSYGSLRIKSLEEYVRAGTGNEHEAVWFSEILIPHLIGYDTFSRFFSKPSATNPRPLEPSFGEIFEKLGVDPKSRDPEDDRTALGLLKAIQGRGEIPKWVMQHPHYPECRVILLEKIALRHYMDPYQLQIRYENLLEVPDVMETAVRFSKKEIIVTDVEAHERNFQPTLDRIMAQPEGSNRLKAKLARMSNEFVMSTALRLSYAGQLINENGTADSAATRKIQTQIDSLEIAYHELWRLHSLVKDTEASDENLEINQQIEEIWQKHIGPARECLDGVIESTLLRPIQAGRFREIEYPFLKPYSYVVPNEAWRRVREMERQALVNAGLSSDLYEPVGV